MFPVRFEPGILFLQIYHVLFLVLFTMRALCINQASVHSDFSLLQKPDFALTRSSVLI